MTTRVGQEEITLSHFCLMHFPFFSFVLYFFVIRQLLLIRISYISWPFWRFHQYNTFLEKKKKLWMSFLISRKKWLISEKVQGKKWKRSREKHKGIIFRMTRLWRWLQIYDFESNKSETNYRKDQKKLSILQGYQSKGYYYMERCENRDYCRCMEKPDTVRYRDIVRYKNYWRVG